MAQKKNPIESYILIIEAVVFFGLGALGRALLDRALAPYNLPAVAATAIKIALFLAFVLLAVYVDRLVNRYLKHRGLIE